MPKKKMTPDTHDHFRITAHVITDQVGPVLAELARRSVVVSNCELVSDVLRYKRNKTKPSAKKIASSSKRYDVSNLALITQFAKRQKGEFTLPQVRKMLAKHGRPESSGSPVCQKLIEQKRLRRIGDGVYAVTAKAKLNGHTEAVAHG